MSLPQTAFSLRAHAREREPKFRRATTEDLYRWQREHLRRDDQPDFVLHDGPPYANGGLHAGWDCHGLPIELKALAESGSSSLSPLEIRETARKVAQRELDGQRESFMEFGIMADWSDKNTYRTMNFEYEAGQLEMFAEMVGQGLIGQHFRPVYWSPSSHTALAEAEIEYDENHESRSAYVKFQLLPSEALLHKWNVDKDIHLAVWTTTPWSLLSNMALAVHPDTQYSLVQAESGEYLLVATDLQSSLSKISVGLANNPKRSELGDLKPISTCMGHELVGLTYRFQFMNMDEHREVFAAPFVTTSSGTGIVHMAPAHGHDDYDLWRDSGRMAQKGIVSPIDDYGRLRMTQQFGLTPAIQEAIKQLDGQNALQEGNQSILKMLDEHDMLLGEQPYKHSYPIDWRTKQPLLVRATAQWFADLTKVGPAAKNALKDVQFVPKTGKNRLESLIGRRSEWCISRQRVWGVPLPAVYNAETGQALLTKRNVEHILDVFRKHNTMDVWWTLEPETFVAPEYRSSNIRWEIKKDTLDVWFDSGSSWVALQKALGRDLCSPGPCADVYIEGTDQHRGWFQSSLLTRVATCNGAAPYKTLLTHGFVVDDSGRKMSKSIGNVISPQTFIHGDAKMGIPPFGTDVMRWWTAKSDYTRDIPISPVIMKHSSDEVRKLRSSARFLLANLGDVPRNTPLPPELSLLNRYILHELRALEQTCLLAFTEFDYAKVTRRLNEFVTTTLSAFYFDVVKDPLYAGGNNRNAILAVMNRILETITCILAPILPHLAEEIHWYRDKRTMDPEPSQQFDSVFQLAWSHSDPSWEDADAAIDMHRLMRLRADLFAILTASIQAQYVSKLIQTG
ncbi:isoleucine--tRNA ligase [Malassezia yamatoensis]|uniref:isoleucine--tRNA ligase n=1 Tax=Malassezia yamatoensis TaxID=253288 RepID=A0AAJ5YQH4_9BASI|nr:isoleucine--tRNA ligase [Malassezia yamatoensis]